MNKSNRFFNELNLIKISVYIFIIISAIIFFNSYDKSFLNNKEIYKIHIVDVSIDGNITKNIKLPKQIQTNKPINIIFELPNFDKNYTPSISMFLAYSELEVYSDTNELIYKFKTPEKTLSKSGGYRTVLFDVPNRIKTKSVRLKIIPKINLPHYRISNIMFGRKSDIITDEFFQSFFIIFIIILLIINFLILFLFNFRENIFIKQNNYSILNLSIFGLFCAFYFFSGVTIIPHFIGAVDEFFYFLEYSLMGLLFVPFNNFLKYRLNLKFKIFFDIASTSLIINTLSQILLTILKIKEFKELANITFFIIMIELLILIFSVVFTNGKKYPFKNSVILPIIIIFIIAIISLIYQVVFGLQIFRTTPIIVAFAFIMIEAREIYTKYTFYQKEQAEKEFYKKLAITDSLTGLHNRAAQEVFINNIQMNKVSGYIISIDINNLKYINDKYGHSKGDLLITALSDILNSFKKAPYINVFRIGGDEFFMFVEKEETFDIEYLIDDMKNKYRETTGFENKFKPSISVGYDYYDSSKKDEIKKIYNVADKKMYEDKALHKEISKK